jgi:hypothetical protein
MARASASCRMHSLNMSPQFSETSGCSYPLMRMKRMISLDAMCSAVGNLAPICRLSKWLNICTASFLAFASQSTGQIKYLEFQQSNFADQELQKVTLINFLSKLRYRIRLSFAFLIKKILQNHTSVGE